MPAAKRVRMYKNYYYMGDLTEQDIQKIQAIYNMKSVDILKNILYNITLRDFQTIIPAAAYINKRYFCGDSPGLGKTVEAAAYLKLLKNKNELKKFIFCTTKDAMFQIRGEIEYYTGLKVLPIWGDSQHVRRIFKYYNVDNFDGIIIPHSGLINNELLKQFTIILPKFNVFILDESSCIKNEKTQTFKNACMISQQMERVLFLNGTVFETHLMDFYWQIYALNPRILPAKSRIQKEYCIIDPRAGFWKSELVNSNGVYRLERRFVRTWQVAGYKNQQELKERLKFHYYGRDKKQVYDNMPEHDYILEPVDPSAAQLNCMNSANYDVVLNSPSTGGYPVDFDKKSVPKLKRCIELTQSLVERGESVVIYARFIEAQYKIKQELENLGIQSEIINGSTADNDRENIRVAFNLGEFPVLITNIERAINLEKADSMILYTIPTNPSTAYQVMCRIDRNNDKNAKTYFFMVYSNTPESEHLKGLIADRELNANLFTGKSVNVFETLKRQLLSLEEKIE